MNLTPSEHTVGDLTRHYRRKAKISQGKFGERVGMSKSHVSKIETGLIIQPEYSTMLRIVKELNIPMNEMILCYVKYECRADILQIMLLEAIGLEDAALTKIVASKYLESPHSDSLVAIAKLYDTTEPLEDPDTKLALFKVIINYSRGHGVMPYLAKAQLQSYLIERDDFSRLRETYDMGKYVLKYIEFLSDAERITLYYRLAVHAFILRMPKDIVTYCDLVRAEPTESEFKIHAVGMLREAYLSLGNYDMTEKYIEEYRMCSPYDDNHIMVEAMLASKRGYKELAITQFEVCLRHCRADYVINVVNELVSNYIQLAQLGPIPDLLLLEEEITKINYKSPLKRAELARFYKQKGDYYALLKDLKKSVNNYLLAAGNYVQIDDNSSEHECLMLMFRLYRTNQRSMDIETIELLEKYLESCFLDK
ncbi:helix-turn-helix domain-containing protein [Paenibacillus sp. 481]|uniref:helix-turn-helix domain-containing protein n=1 Tax=Paenibacillus sp. 481 TaxID=2835869 RepID=UPI001E55CBDE|nr:helix-turn-helix transcriptional regulator [Paenibacillus sp. 481]UHA74440.1 helix-turn-helix domain-containing protein [Paenibacillus sp. 481]